MATITWTLTGVEEVLAGLREKETTLTAAIGAKIDELGARLLQRVQENLSGEVLHQRSGQLIRSVEWLAAEWVGMVCQTEVGIDDGSPSFLVGLVQEYGGEKWYDIYPVKAKALAWEGPEGMVFAHHVHHPPLPERSYLRSALAEMEDTIYAELEATLDAAIGGEGAVGVAVR